MRHWKRAFALLFCTGLLAGLFCSQPAQSQGTKEVPKMVKLAGASWYSDLEEAKKLAQDREKPLLVFDMVGQLDEDWC